MANTITTLLEINSSKHSLKDLINGKDIVSDIMGDAEYRVNTDWKNDRRVEVMTTFIDLENAKNISLLKTTELIITAYDTAIGYAKKIVINNGYTVSVKAIRFGMDLEFEVMKEADLANKEFFDILKEWIDKHGNEESEMIVKGDLITIDENVCENVKLLEWYKGQSNKILLVTKVELDVDGVWVENCGHRIDLNCVKKASDTV